MSERFVAPPEFAPRSPVLAECTACGACCSAPDIHALQKPLGVPCVHLSPECLCAVYTARPAVCRSYQPDWVCGEVAPLPTLSARTRRFLEIYGLEQELPVASQRQRVSCGPWPSASAAQN